MSIIQTKASIQSEALELILHDITEETDPKVITSLIKASQRIRESLLSLMGEIELPHKAFVDARYTDNRKIEVQTIPDSADSIDSKLGLTKDE